MDMNQVPKSGMQTIQIGWKRNSKNMKKKKQGGKQ